MASSPPGTQFDPETVTRLPRGPLLGAIMIRGWLSLGGSRFATGRGGTLTAAVGVGAGAIGAAPGAVCAGVRVGGKRV
jgi:hypothetical protein